MMVVLNPELRAGHRMLIGGRAGTIVSVEVNGKQGAVTVAIMPLHPHDTLEARTYNLDILSTSLVIPPT